MAVHVKALAAICLAMAAASPAFAHQEAGAQSPSTAAPAPSIHRLPDAEVEEILSAAAAREEPVEEPGRKIHGEFGVEIGTGGYRAAYGSALIPLGDDGAAVVSFESSRNDPYRWYGHEGRRRR